jgi:hypothetical protein
MTIEHISLIIAAAINVAVLIGGLIKLSQVATHVQKTFDYFAIEHEILIRDYCTRNNLSMAELPTRLGRAPWWPDMVKR